MNEDLLSMVTLRQGIGDLKGQLYMPITINGCFHTQVVGPKPAIYGMEPEGYVVQLLNSQKYYKLF